MLEQSIRKPYQKLLVDKISYQLSGKIHPLVITFLALLTGLFSAVSILINQPLLAICLLLLSGYFDTLDGTLARVSNMQSDIGCVLDIIVDRIVEIAIILSLCFYQIDNRAILGLFMLAAIILCISAFLVIGIFTNQQKNAKSFFYSSGLIERAEAFIFFILMILLPSYFNWLAYLFSILVFITALHHLIKFILWANK